MAPARECCGEPTETRHNLRSRCPLCPIPPDDAQAPPMLQRQTEPLPPEAQSSPAPRDALQDTPQILGLKEST